MDSVTYKKVDRRMMAEVDERKLLSAGELDVRYIKLLKNRREEEDAEYYDLRNRFRRLEMSPTGQSTPDLLGKYDQNSTEYENLRRIRWGTLSRQVLQPEDPKHAQPQMRKKRKKKQAQINTENLEKAFQTRSDVWLGPQEDSFDHGSVIGFMLYVLFLGVGLVIIYGVLEVGYNYYATKLSQIFTQTPFNTSLGITKTFNEIRTIEQFWDYVNQVFLKVMYGYSEGQTRSAVIDKSGVFWLFENVLVGIPRMRQLRVKNGSCEVATAVKDMISTCYGYYSDDWMDKEPFGLQLPDPWRYSEPNSGSAPYNGKISTYGGGGYMVNITSDAGKTEKLIQELIQNKWIRKGARAVFIDFTTYTPNNNLFCIVKLAFELPPSGGVIPTAHFYTMKFLRYVNTLDYVVFGAEMAYCGFIAWYTFVEVLELLIGRKRFFFRLWNVVDIAILIFSYFTILAGLVRYTLVKVNMADYVDQIALGHHQSFDRLLEAQLVFNTGIAILSFLVWLKLLKFSVLFKSMYVIFTAFGRIKTHLLALTMLIFTTIFGFSLVATMLFGTEVAEFTTLWNSLFSLVGLFFGGMYFYPKCAATHQTLAPVFFMLYIFTVFILMVNVYVALVVYGFRKAVETLEDQRERKYIWDRIRKIFGHILTTFCMKKRAAQLKNTLDAIENKKKYKELLRIVKKHGFRGNALIILFQKHFVFPKWRLPFAKVSDVYEDMDTWTQLYIELSEHDRLLSNVAKAARKVELLDRAVSSMMIKVEVLVEELLYEERATN